MKLHSAIKINGKEYPAGSDIAWSKIYPFFILHMAMFGGSGFLMAYIPDGPPVAFLYAHGGFATLIYTVFYFAFFGRDQVKWMFINAALGIFGIYAQIGWILALFGRNIGDYAWYVHVIPMLYYILFTFLLYQAALDITGAREDGERRRRTEKGYVFFSTLVYALLYVLT